MDIIDIERKIEAKVKKNTKDYGLKILSEYRARQLHKSGYDSWILEIVDRTGLKYVFFIESISYFSDKKVPDLIKSLEESILSDTHKAFYIRFFPSYTYFDSEKNNERRA